MLTGYYRVTTKGVNTWQLSDTDPNTYWTAPAVRQYTSETRGLTIMQSVNNKKARPWSSFLYQRNVGWGGIITDHNMGVQTVWPQWGAPYGKIFYRGPLCANGTYTAMPWQGTPPEFAAVEAVAQAKLFATLKEARTQWNAAVALGEGWETMRMLANMARRLHNGYQAFRHGQLDEAYRHLTGRKRPFIRDQRTMRDLKGRVRSARGDSWKRDIASNWMEFSFGWKPLLSDIDSAARYAAEKRVGKTYRVYDVSRAHKLEVVSKVISQDAWPLSHRYETYTIRNIKVRLSYSLDPVWLRNPSTMAELGFTDPATVIWELLPLSCFVDYVVNVGQVLESLYEFSQWSVVRGLKSYRFETVVLKSMESNGVTSSPAASGFSRLEIGPWGRYSFRWHPPMGMLQRECGRIVLTALPTAVKLRIKPENPFDLKKGQWANVIGLLYLSFTGAKPKDIRGAGFGQ